MTAINRDKKWIVWAQVSAIIVGLCWPWAAPAQAKHAPSYKLVDLGVVGPAGQPFHITNTGIIAGAVQAPDGADHAVIYFHRRMLDINSPGLGGADSEAIGANRWGEVVGGANSRNTDPAGEDFCGFQTLGISAATASCVPFLWLYGTMIALPTLDDNRGNNGVANSINALGEIAGAAENTVPEPTCPSYDPGKLQFQQYQFKPVLWRGGAIRELPTLGGDPVGSAAAVNNRGQSVGSTGTCSVFNFVLGFSMHPLHAVLWERDGTAVDLKSLGGSDQSMWGNVAEGINSAGHVVGSSSLPDNVTFHAYLWTRNSGRMRDLGTAAGLSNSLAIAINDKDEVVGISTDLATQFIATLWKDGVAWDLNTLIPKSPLQLLSGCSINSRGEIIGLAVDSNGALHGYKLLPVDGSQP